MKGMTEPKYLPSRKPHPPGTPHSGPHGHQPDKAAESTNLTNPEGYQTNGFKKHRDNTPI